MNNARSLVQTPAAPADLPLSVAAPTEPSLLSSLLERQDLYRIALEPRDQDKAWQLATDMADLKLHGVDTPANGMARIMAGRSLGLPAMASIQTIALIWNPSANDGKGGYLTVMYARAKLALLYRDTHIVEYIEPVVLTNEKATWVGKRVKGRKEAEYTFTIEDARIAGLVDRGANDAKKAMNNYNKHPGPMLQWRACGRLCDLIGADILLGIGTREEIEDDIAVKRAAAEAVTEAVERVRPTPSVSLEERLAGRPAIAPPTLPETTPTTPRDFVAEAEQLKADIAEVVKNKDPAGKKRVREAFKAFEQAAPPEVFAVVLEFYTTTIGKKDSGERAPGGQGSHPGTSPTHNTPSPVAGSPSEQAGSSSSVPPAVPEPSATCASCKNPVGKDAVPCRTANGAVGLRHPGCPAPEVKHEREPGEEG